MVDSLTALIGDKFNEVVNILVMPVAVLILIVIFAGLIAYIFFDESYIASMLVQIVVMIIMLAIFPWFASLF